MRKIPAKKHRGVKDPYKQQEQRLDKIKHKVNAAPKSADAQEIPRRLQLITKFNSTGVLKSDVQHKKKKRKKNKLIDGTKFMDRDQELPGMSRPTQLVPALKQQHDETERTFLKRVDQATKIMMKETEFEDKYQVEVQRDSMGEVLAVEKREKNDPLAAHNPVHRQRGERKRKARQERDFRRKHRKKKVESDDEYPVQEDKVEFGEVVTAPPSLHTEKLLRKVSTTELSQPRSFLFMEKLKKTGESSSPTATSGKKAPRKEGVSAARQRVLEQERLSVVEAYRRVKAERYKSTIPL